MTTDDKGEVHVDPRVALATERTVLAWFRTGLALMAFGFVVARFGVFLRGMTAAGAAPQQPTMDTSSIGVFMVGIGVVVNIWASARHYRMIQQLSRGEPFRAAPRGPVAVGIASAVGGLILLATLLSALLR